MINTSIVRCLAQLMREHQDTEWTILIVRMRQAEYSFAAIGKALKLSRQKANDLFLRAMREFRDKPVQPTPADG